MFTLDALNSITTVEGLRHAVLESLFSDAKAYTWQAKDFGSDNQRGWWASDVKDEHGSKLWLLAREKTTAETQAQLVSFINKALEWVDEFGSFELITELSIERINFQVVVKYLDLQIEVSNAN